MWCVVLVSCMCKHKLHNIMTQWALRHNHILHYDAMVVHFSREGVRNGKTETKCKRLRKRRDKKKERERIYEREEEKFKNLSPNKTRISFLIKKFRCKSIESYLPWKNFFRSVMLAFICIYVHYIYVFINPPCIQFAWQYSLRGSSKIDNIFSDGIRVITYTDQC